MTESPDSKSKNDPRAEAKGRAPRRADVIDVLASQPGARHTSEIAERLELAPRFLGALGRVLDDLVFDGTVVAMPGHRFKLSAPEAPLPGAVPPRTFKLSAPEALVPGAVPPRTFKLSAPEALVPGAVPPRTFKPSAPEAPVPGGASPRHRHTRDADAARGTGGASRGAMLDGMLSVNPRGFGFVVASRANAGAAEDVYVPREALGGGLHGDRVKVRVVARSDRGLEGAIEEVLERRPARFAGTLERRGKSAWVTPDDTRLRGPIVLAHAPDAPHGHAVLATITRFPETPDENPEGVVDEVLGAPGTIEVEARKILGTHAVEETFSERAEAEARSFGSEVPAWALEGREDLTHLPLPTIDPSDARDHDDAVWATRNEDGSYRAWIAIADVSTYVTEGSAIDAAALSRGCSIYLPTRAIPMLPRALSSDLCSLLPDKTRLCLAIEIDLDATGATTNARVIEGFMRSRAKLTYEGVAHALGLSANAPASPEAIAMRDDLEVLYDLSRVLRAARLRRGALQFHAPEARVVVDPVTGHPTNVEKRGKDPGVAKAYEVVEELMLLANETVAGIMVAKGAPTIFRNHGAPDGAKLERFGAMCARLGVPFDAEEAADPKKLAAFIKRIRANPRASILDTLLIRSMKQAAYDVSNIGHYGLASPAYLHFTSPIRRYPDVVVHRTLRRIARGESIDKSEKAASAMREAAQRASTSERRAMEVERETVDLYRAFLMRDHVGETFTASVGGFGTSGAYVSIDAPYVDVLVKTDALGTEAYSLDDEGLSLVAARSGDRVDLGDGMLVQIEDVSLERRTVFGRRVGRVDLGGDESASDADGAPRRERRSKKQRTTSPPKSAPASRGRKSSAGGKSAPSSAKSAGSRASKSAKRTTPKRAASSPTKKGKPSKKRR
ncbi:MAG: VacB/RNase II family 3'-5' exoribonuclease [Polyangiaceae bacterium]